jgi:hypothetical protein
MKVGIESSIREIDGFLFDNRCAHHIARCSWAGNILRVAPGDQLGLKAGIIGVEKLLARAGVEVFALVSAIPPHTFGKTRRCIDEAHSINK